MKQEELSQCRAEFEAWWHTKGGNYAEFDIAWRAWQAAYSRRPATAQEVQEREFTDSATAALLWVLYHHQGGSSNVGQPIRFALGIGQYDRLSESQVSAAKSWGLCQHRAAPSDGDLSDDEIMGIYAAHGRTPLQFARAIAARIADENARDAGKRLAWMREIIADDSVAVEFQSLRQYRNMLLRLSVKPTDVAMAQGEK